MDRFTKEYLNVIKEEVTNDSIKRMFYNDVNNFVHYVNEGYGYILKNDILNQFNRYTDNQWTDNIFDKNMIEQKIIEHCNDADIEVFETEDEMIEAHPNDF